jgi:hypothetical protein
VDTSQGGRTGYLVEFDNTQTIFENPKEKHTKDYIQGQVNGQQSGNEVVGSAWAARPSLMSRDVWR